MRASRSRMRRSRSSTVSAVGTYMVEPVNEHIYPEPFVPPLKYLHEEQGRMVSVLNME